MAERNWSVLWVPHGAGETRSFTVSARALEAIGGSAAVLVGIGLSFVVMAVR